MAIGRVNTGGGGSGGTLTVTGVAGHTVTATKDGKTYTRTFNSSCFAVFKGLATGTWTLTMTDGEQTATRTVTVNADYAVTITYFIATINVTYPSGSTCKATHTDGTVLNAPDTSGTWACVVPKSGTWTILAEDTSTGNSKSVDVSITADGQSESVTLNYYLAVLENGVVSPLTGGIDVINKNTTFTDGKIVCKSLTLSQGNYFTTNSAINMAPYSTLYCRIKFVKKNDYDGRFGLTTTKLTDTLLDEALKLFTNYYNTKNSSITSGTIKEISLDISNVSTDSYIALCGMDDLEIDKIILYP